MTSDVLGQIVAINAEGDFLPRIADRESLIANLEQIRPKLLGAAARRPDHPLLARHLAFVDKRLGFAFMRDGRWEHARSMFAESLPCWERVLRDNPLDKLACINQSLALRGFAQMVDRQGRLAECEALLRRAVDAA